MAQDANGNYVVGVTPSTYTPGASMRGGLHGSGPPDNSLGSNGNTYTDDDSGDFYIKYGDVWHIFQGAPGGSGESGVGSPEGVITAPPGTTYVDLAGTPNNSLWAKVSGVGNTGWVQLIG